jgi:hypothetical protein
MVRDAGDVVEPFVVAMHYKPEGRGFDSRECHNPGRTVAVGSTQPLTEMITTDISLGT